MRFVDTNILPYAVSRAVDERAKTETALEILERRDVGLSAKLGLGRARL